MSAPDKSPTALHAIVRGRVQGVGYRYFALRRARALGVCGFVRNLADGSVEARVEGAQEALDAFVLGLREGPSFGKVDAVDVTPAEPRGFDSFEIR